MPATIVRALSLLSLVCACRPGPQPSTPPQPDGAAKPQVAAEPASTEPAEPEPEPAEPSVDTSVPFPEAIGALPAEGTDYADAALALFRAHHPDTSNADEAPLRRDLDLLIGHIEKKLAPIQAASDADLARSSAACEVTEQCSSGDDPDGTGRAWIQQLRKSAITFIYAGEGMTEPAVDLVALRELLAPSLTELASKYLAALALDQAAMSAHDEGGYGGDPKVLVDAIVAFESLAKTGGEVYGSVGQTRSLSLAYTYLQMAVAPFFDDPIELPKPFRESYVAFLEDHADSAYAPAVKSFLAQMKKARFRARGSRIEAMADKAMKKVHLPK